MIDMNIDIDAPQEIVWKVSQDFSRRTEWDERITGIEVFTPGLAAKGTRWRIHANFFGFKVWVDNEYITFNAPKHSAVKSVGVSKGNLVKAVNGSWHYKVTGENSSNFHTRLSLDFGGKLRDKVIGAYYARITRKSLENLKRLAEVEYRVSLSQERVSVTV